MAAVPRVRAGHGAAAPAPIRTSDDLRRAARNDAAFTSLDWSEHSIESEHANALAKSLAGNTHLQSIRIRYGIYMTANAAKRLEAALEDGWTLGALAARPSSATHSISSFPW